MHADEFVVGRGGGYSVKFDEDRVKSRVLRQVQELKNEGLDARVYLARTWMGGAARAIAAIAEKVKADLIIVGRPKHSLLYDLFTGGVVRSLTRIASCPVLVVPESRSARA